MFGVKEHHLHLFFARDALRDCQIHLDILRSSASALAGGVAQLSTVAVAATIIDAAAAVAAATRSAARATGTVTPMYQKRYNPSAQSEELPMRPAWHLQPSKQLHSQHVERRQPAKSIDHAQHHDTRAHDSSFGQQSAVDPGITVQDLEEGIAGLARSCPSSPLIPVSASRSRNHKSMHLGASVGGNGHASLVLVTCGSRSPGMTYAYGQPAQDANNSPGQRRERAFRGTKGAGGAGAEVWEGCGKIPLSTGNGEDDRGGFGSSLASGRRRLHRPVT
jgi:hypothetical protein